MFHETYDDMLETQGQWFVAMHCVICGNIVDPVILQNRRLRAEPQRSTARVRMPVAA